MRQSERDVCRVREGNREDRVRHREIERQRWREADSKTEEGKVRQSELE